MIEERFPRRYSFYGSLLAGAVPSWGSGGTPSLPALGYASLTERLNIAAVGFGMRGNQILVGAAATENIVALCDVGDDRLARASQPYQKAAKIQAPAAADPAWGQSAAGLDPGLQRKRARSIAILGRMDVHRVAGARNRRPAGARQVALGREEYAIQQQRKGE